jgi:hypothetical protein
MKIFVRFTIITLLFFSPLQRILAEQKPDEIYYSNYGAKGDGVTDDLEAIVKAHAAANETGRPVKADPGATYYIGGADRTALIQTNTDWGDARFVIDDREVENRHAHIFHVSSRLARVQLTAIKTLKKNQRKLDLTLSHPSFIVVVDHSTRRYIRYGPNQNDGSPQTDVFVVDRKGRVDMKAPVIWDFDQISSMTACPVDDETLFLAGGHFTTVANRAESRYTYYNRGIHVTRSNVVIDRIQHTITGEPDHGAPYGGFLTITDCTEVTVQNCRLSGHRTYVTTGSAGRPVSMGSYDLSVNRSVNVTFRNCKQLNDIHDSRYWGIFGSNYSKNITFDAVEFSRFDAHQGVANATIRNSTLGHQGINIIGCGRFLIENTQVCGRHFINLRDDYGSTWEGDVIIRNCEYIPRNGARSDAVLINGSHSGRHDFGYACYMPHKITIDGLFIHDGNPVDNYQGPKLFAVFRSDRTGEDDREMYPYVITREVEIRNLRTQSGKKYLVSNHPFIFRGVKIKEK